MTKRTYAALIDVNEFEIQNVQELVSAGGHIYEDIEGLDGSIKEAYALLGEYDYLVLFTAADRGAALQTAVSIERYGFDVETMPAIPVDEMGPLVEDI